MKKLALGVDIGGTNLKIGIVSPSGKLLKKKVVPCEPEKGAEFVAKKIAQSRDELAKNVTCCGVGVPGPINKKRTHIIQAPNLANWLNVPIKKIIEDALEIPVVIENDANVAAFGEAWVGAGKKAKTLILFTLGTGVGGGIILDGELWVGSFGGAGELGHITVEKSGYPCACGNTGCLELYASASAMAREYARRAGAKKSAEEICNMAGYGDKAARDVLENAARYLGIAIASIVHTIEPELIILTGGLAEAGDILIKSVETEVRARIFKQLRSVVKIVKGELGTDAGIIGAAGWALKSLK